LDPSVATKATPAVSSFVGSVSFARFVKFCCAVVSAASKCLRIRFAYIQYRCKAMIGGRPAVWRNDIKFVPNLPRNCSSLLFLGAEPTGLEPQNDLAQLLFLGRLVRKCRKSKRPRASADGGKSYLQWSPRAGIAHGGFFALTF
jgi:hypothetical protein